MIDHDPLAKPRTMVTAAAIGILFGIGLVISGMTQPAKVIGFLDIGGAWDPSLAFVMAAAIAVYAGITFMTRRRTRPLFADRYSPPDQTAIDARLVIGSAVFGVGWGLAGYCPGPALVSLGHGGTSVVIFVGAMIAGTYGTRALLR